MADMHETVSFSRGLEEVLIRKSQSQDEPSRERVKISHEVQEHARRARVHNSECAGEEQEPSLSMPGDH